MVLGKDTEWLDVPGKWSGIIVRTEGVWNTYS